VSATLKEMLADKDKRQRVSALYAIGEIRLAGFQKHVLAALRDQDADIRRNALIAIRKISVGAQAPILATLKDSVLPLLEDQEPAVRLQAVTALEATMGGEAFMPLVKRLLMEKAAGVLAQIIDTIGRFRKPETLSIIDSYLDNSEAQVAIAALNAIGGIEPEMVTSVVLKSIRRSMKHPEIRVRRKTVETLWKLGAFDVLNELCVGLRHERQDIRKMFLQCFGEVCAEVSRSGGELLTTFERELKAAIAEHQKRLEQSKSSAAQADAQNLWNLAAGHIRSGRNTEAADALERLLKMAPRHVQAWMALGDLAHRGDDHVRAIDCFRSALALEPNLPKALYALGQIHHARGEWKQAAEALHATIRLYPKLPQAYLLLAEALEELQRPQDAYKALLRLADLVPDNPAALQRLARAAFFVGDSTKAVAAAKKA
ncbi:MAG TPA: tetratricopeptide repeat protein, partial [Candidatus Ozemobacteraceae bacterium]|nr:tetratricopeptide repeat protein [Candidatus Ozemobacteraceae bacterium]